MHKSKDKTEILQKIMEFYNLKSKADVARFFEVKPQTVSTWFSRNTVDYDSIFERCTDMNYNYLFKSGEENSADEPAGDYRVNETLLGELKKMIGQKDDKIMELSEKVGQLKAELQHLKKR